MEIVKVIIKKATLPTYWYADKIGQIFECYQRDSTNYQVVEDKDSFCFIVADDCIPTDCIGRKPIKKLKFI
jgi:hypothetical protein